MSSTTDFTKMTLEELTPIVSMRPGKEYSASELRQARAVFMALLHGETITPLSDAEGVADQPSACPPDDCLCDSDKAETLLAEESTPQEASPLPDGEADVPSPEYAAPEETEEEFILRTDSRLARVLYILYAYLVVPLLALEGLALLIFTVLTIVAIPNIPHLVIPVGCSVFYTMAVTIAWHQLLHRTRAGLYMNRTLIIVSVLRGLSMMIHWGNTLTGILFIAFFFLFLIFFMGYDNTFIIKSPKKRRGR